MHNPKFSKLRYNYSQPLNMERYAYNDNSRYQQKDESSLGGSLLGPMLPVYTLKLESLIRSIPSPKKQLRYNNVQLKRRCEFIKLNLIQLARGLQNPPGSEILPKREDKLLPTEATKLNLNPTIKCIRPQAQPHMQKFKSRRSLIIDDVLSSDDTNQIAQIDTDTIYPKTTTFYSPADNDVDVEILSTKSFLKCKPRRPRRVVYLSKSRNEQVQVVENFCSIQETLRETIEDFGITDYIQNLK